MFIVLYYFGSSFFRVNSDIDRPGGLTDLSGGLDRMWLTMLKKCEYEFEIEVL